MGTRGLIQFTYKGQNIKVFNRLDSYPSALGVFLLNCISELVQEWNQEEFEALIHRIMKELGDNARFFEIEKEFKVLATNLATDNQTTESMQTAIMNIMIEYTYTINFDEHTLAVVGHLCAGEYNLKEESIQDLISVFKDEDDDEA